MVPRKSQGEIYLRLCMQLVCDDPLSITQSKVLSRDLETMVSRFAKEGLSFLTKTLPKLGKALDQGLLESRLNVPRGFKLAHRCASRPAFLQAYFSLVFDPDGLLLEEPNVVAIKHLRQVLFFAYKLELPYSPADEEAVIDNFLRNERELEQLVFGEDQQELLDLASLITSRIFRKFNPKDITPKHGPGAVATGEKLEQKWHFRRLYNGIHQFYPYYNYFVVGGARELLDRRNWYFSLERLESGQSKVVLVPKDSRGPRLISAEPLEYQWVQQGLGRKLVDFLEGHSPTRGQINFRHQDVNQQLALGSSSNQNYATLDLQDASDRVSLELVRRVFRRTPELLRAIEASRSAATTLPDGRVVTLSKHAPMGSALCFPVEAYVFWVILVASRIIRDRVPLHVAGRSVFVYGDDIVVPTTDADLSMHALESVGLLVNRGKCCFKGFFRESCGVDAYKGVVITPARLRKPWTGLSTDGTAYSSYTALANELGVRGYTGSADLIWELLERTYGKVPYGTSRSSFPCRIVNSPEKAERYNLSKFPVRVNGHYQRLEFQVKCVLSSHKDLELEGWPRMLRDVIMPQFEDPSVVVIPRSTKIKRRWSAVY